MSIRNFEELVSLARQRGKKRIAVACADDELVLNGIKMAVDEDLAEPILFGNKEKIEKRLESMNLPRDWRIEHFEGSEIECAFKVIEFIKDGKADLIMKGHMQTSSIFKAILNKERGLANGKSLSHIAFIESPHYHKIFGSTDGGLNIIKNFDQKVSIVRNAVDAFHKLGYDTPKVGLLSFVEKVVPGDPETEDWAKISEMAKNGEFGQALIEGPLSFDLCLSEEAKKVKNFQSEVAGDIDVMVSPTITACNASTKAIYMHGGLAAGIVVGARVPVIALSRADVPRSRLSSIAMAIALLGTN